MRGPTLPEKIQSLIGEIGAWIDGHAVDIVIAVAVGLLVALLLLGARAIAIRLIARRRGGESHWSIIFARVLARTSILFIVAASAKLVAGQAATPHFLLRAIHILFVIAAAIQAAIWARELILGYVHHRLGEADDQGRLGSAIGIIRLLVTIALFAIAIIVILDNLGVDVTGLIAGLGIGGIAIGLAAQGIFSDLFAALSIIFDKPFRRGDAIRIDGAQGEVEDIGLKTTRIRAITGEQVIVSNAKLLDQQIRNLDALDHRRFTLMLPLDHRSEPDRIAAIADAAALAIAAHKTASLVRSGLAGITPAAIDYELSFDVKGHDQEFAFAVRHDILLRMLRSLNDAGIALATPAQPAPAKA